jgi:hypothetical membrane protein
MTKIAGYLILLGVSQFLLLMIISESLYPSYSVHSNYISDLGVGKTAILFNTSIILMGLLIMVASSSLDIRTLSILLFVIGLSSALVGIFPENTGFPHLISALFAFFSGGIAAVVSSIYFRFYLWTILGFISLIALFLFITHIYGYLGVGGMEQMIVYPQLIWGISFGSRISVYEPD